jgi:hypothetical protein
MSSFIRWALPFLFALFPCVVLAEAIPVELARDDDGGWRLLRGGEPWVIRGAGGDASKEALAAAGGNTFRTWGVDPELGEQLDEAHRLGLAVVVGHWLGHERHGFDYDDLDAVAEQFERVRRDVLAHKDHPAVLMWGIGNEAEGFEEGDDAAYWSHLQALAAMVKDLDPHHPTMSVTADIGGRRVEAVHRLCPDIDVFGVNTYGGLPSLPERYRAVGGEKPIVITEFGPPGTWETGRNAFGVPPELTSTAKAAIYRDAYTKGFLDAGDLCLGGFAFLWGQKMEATATWFGMFLPSGEKLAAVDAMTEIWTGTPPADLCPEIRSLTVLGSDVVAPGDVVEVVLDVVDPEGGAVTVDWEIRSESEVYETGGDAQSLPFALDGVITASSTTGATLTMPGGGLYRLYAFARDGNGGAATANVPLSVDGPVASPPIRLPVFLYGDGKSSPWVPSGWMGGYMGLSMDVASTVSPRSGKTCLEFTYADPGHWVGVVWQHPANDWGDLPGGFDLTGAKELVFWARGAEGGERIDFGVGLLGSDKTYSDSVRAEKKGVKLSTKWKRYTIDLEDEDLTQVKSAFWFSMAGRGRPITFYLDDVRFE